MARTIAPTTARSAANTLPPLTDPLTTPRATRLTGRKLRPQPFRPEAGQPNEADGVPLSRLGRRFREVFAAAHDIDESDVDLGLVRLVESLSADNDHNVNGLAAPQVKRTEHGTLTQVRFMANTPMLMPWLANGRSLRRMGNELRGSTRIVTEASDHSTLALPVMEVSGPDAVLELIAAQRRVLGLESYSSARPLKRDRIDSIVQFGVLDPPDVVLTQLVSPSAGTAWVPQAAEGAQRYFSAMLAMEALANRNVARVASRRWYDRGTPRLRDLEPNDLRAQEEALLYSSTAAAGYFPPPADQAAWMERADGIPGAVAFQLLRTTEINLVIAVHPDPVVTADFPNPAAETIQEMIRGYHMPGKAKDAWEDADLNGLIAIGAIDDFAGAHRITSDERAAWFGEEFLPWAGPAAADDGTPGNRLVAITKMLAALTAQDGLEPVDGEKASHDIVNRYAKLNGRRHHADDRAKVAAAQAIVALDMLQSSWANTLQAALFGLFHSGWFWRTSAHEGHWPRLITTPVDELAAAARRAREAHADDPEYDASAEQRALAALGGVALMLNPALIAERKALSRTGLGGGGKATNVRASDPAVLLRNMARDAAGIDELEDAILALTGSANPTMPTDRRDDQPLTDAYLRGRWLGGEDESEESPFNEFSRRIGLLRDAILESQETAKALRAAKAGHMLGLEEPSEEEAADRDDAHLWDELLYEAIGVVPETADDAIAALQDLSDFFHTGKAYARAASRSSR
ncbi:hypothetical protein [Curtobacterium sp. MCLR17_040]|uniref:hypothetical protein n=1 Tax=Curtobacterium sp. MCLR17_040 TaxID=2175625 RepID=UPI0011B5330E|nr:hypothetical protein [Curtobacterium sp. MCLR17_040]